MNEVVGVGKIKFYYGERYDVGFWVTGAISLVYNNKSKRFKFKHFKENS